MYAVDNLTYLGIGAAFAAGVSITRVDPQGKRRVRRTRNGLILVALATYLINLLYLTTFIGQGVHFSLRCLNGCAYADYLPLPADPDSLRVHVIDAVLLCASIGAGYLVAALMRNSRPREDTQSTA